ncbi:MerR family transcriptional regulator [Caulobacter soli]|uniref:MerR family transcriptional regulator n=1 Tax=Caulobacter soli TaxID=2708539 RepID=UPI0013E9E334|nr:MerR family transcriptional regulator [Caulobacter soli]
MTRSTPILDRRAPARYVSIAELAKRLGVTSRALRHYQDQGLIRSHRIARNVRAYDLETVAMVETIVALREIDLPLAAIRDILALRHEPEAQAEALRAALLEVQADKQRQIVRIDGMLEALPAAPRADGLDIAPWRLVPRASGFDGLAAGDAG